MLVYKKEKNDAKMFLQKKHQLSLSLSLHVAVIPIYHTLYQM